MSYYKSSTQDFDILVCAIHAGHEVGTGDVAHIIHAAMPDRAGLYINNASGHIPSILFHDKLFDSVVGKYKTVISVHGTAETRQMAYVGGLYYGLGDRIKRALGISPTVRVPWFLRGDDPRNVVNRGSCGAGVQIEISYIHLSSLSPLRRWIADTIALAVRRSRP